VGADRVGVSVAPVFLAVLIPAVVLVVLALLVWGVVKLWRRRRRRQRAAEIWVD
jgi:TRAP-type C4-dicarboxylate transport system permease large subunit